MKLKKVHLAHDHREDLTCYQPAGFVLRWYALTLDLSFFAPIDVLVHLPFNRLIERYSAYGYDVRVMALNTLLVVLPLLVYVIAPTALYGQTLGKSIVGLRVVRQDGQAELSLRSVILRETLGKFLSVASLGLGFLGAAWGQARTLHDRIGGTRVIRYRDG